MTYLNDNIRAVQLVSLLLCCYLSCTYAQTPQRVDIVADDSYPPYSYLKNDKMRGIYVEIIEAAAEILAPYYQINILAMPWKRALSEIKQGNAFALIPPYRHLERRPYIWPYSVTLYTETVVAFCYRDVDIIKQINQESVDRKHVVNVGINAGYAILNNELQAAKKAGVIKLWENKDTRANIQKLLRRRIDCYLNDRISTQWELMQLSKEFSAEQYNFNDIHEALLVMSQSAHIGYTDSAKHRFYFKEDFVKRMDEALSLLQSNGSFNRIISAYFQVSETTN